MTRNFVVSLIALVCASCASATCPEPAAVDVPVPSAGEHPGESEHAYYALPGLDHGLIQSPVNILSSEARGGGHAIELSYERTGVESIVNKGHTIELDFPAGATISFDDKTYAVVQTHFHTPSEHRIDGITYPMEIHVVSMAPPETPDAPPEYLVAGLLFRMGEPNAFIEEVIASVPEQAGAERDAKELFLLDLFAAEGVDIEAELPNCYHYRGSLTTPPYSETVEWLVLQHEFHASPEQIQTINRIEGDNARHIQMLFDRVVEN